MGYSPTDFGLVGVVLLFAWKIVEILAKIASKRLNGHVSSSCEDAVEHLATIMETYVGEDRSAHTSLLKEMATQGKQIEELHKAHLGPQAMDPNTGTPRWWAQSK